MKIKGWQKPTLKHHPNECRVIFLGGGCSKLDIGWLDLRTLRICDSCGMILLHKWLSNLDLRTLRICNSCGMILLHKWLSNFALLSSKLTLPVTLT
jgi:hypothetical protein